MATKPNHRAAARWLGEAALFGNQAESPGCSTVVGRSCLIWQPSRGAASAARQDRTTATSRSQSCVASRRLRFLGGKSRRFNLPTTAWPHGASLPTAWRPPRSWEIARDFRGKKRRFNLVSLLTHEIVRDFRGKSRRFNLVSPSTHEIARDFRGTVDSGVKVGLSLFSTSWWVLTDRGRTVDSGVKVGLTLFSPPGGF